MWATNGNHGASAVVERIHYRGVRRRACARHICAWWGVRGTVRVGPPRRDGRALAGKCVARERRERSVCARARGQHHAGVCAGAVIVFATVRRRERCLRAREDGTAARRACPCVCCMCIDREGLAGPAHDAADIV